jgi:peptide chain release factor 3
VTTEQAEKFMDANATGWRWTLSTPHTAEVDHSATLRAVEQQWPKVKFHAA